MTATYFSTAEDWVTLVLKDLQHGQGRSDSRRARQARFLTLAKILAEGPAVGTFKLAPVLSVYGAYHNKSMNSWGGALVYVPEDKATPYHMFVNLV